MDMLSFAIIDNEILAEIKICKHNLQKVKLILTHIDKIKVKKEIHGMIKEFNNYIKKLQISISFKDDNKSNFVKKSQKESSTDFVQLALKYNLSSDLLKEKKNQICLENSIENDVPENVVHERQDTEHIADNTLALKKDYVKNLTELREVQANLCLPHLEAYSTTDLSTPSDLKGPQHNAKKDRIKRSKRVIKKILNGLVNRPDQSMHHLQESDLDQKHSGTSLKTDFKTLQKDTQTDYSTISCRDPFVNSAEKQVYIEQEGVHNKKDPLIHGLKNCEDLSYVTHKKVACGDRQNYLLSRQEVDYENITATYPHTIFKEVDSTLNFLLIGSSGSGKSSTGNTLLGKTYFKTSNRTASTSGDIEAETFVIGSQRVRIIDFPGFTDKHIHDDLIKFYSQNIKKAVKLCDGSFTAVLIILNIKERYTQQEKDIIRVVKGILGEKVLANCGICIFTHGDQFESDQCFEDWCKYQTDDIKTFFQECENRCLLYDNKTSDQRKIKQQLDDLLEMTRNLKTYTEADFRNNETERQKFESVLLLKDNDTRAEKELETIRKIFENIYITETVKDNGTKENLKMLIFKLDELDRVYSISENMKRKIFTLHREIKNKLGLIDSVK